MRELSNIEIAAVSGGSVADDGGAVTLVGDWIINTINGTATCIAKAASAVWGFLFGTSSVTA
jgi:hypothetical protein